MTRKKQVKKVVVIGATKFPLDREVAAQVVEVLQTYPKGKTVFLTRAGVSPFDQFIVRAAGILGYPVLRFIGKGGTDNLERDDDLVREGDAFLCFFAPDHLGEGGTAMVTEKALTARKPVRAYTAVGERLVWAGETEAVP